MAERSNKSERALVAVIGLGNPGREYERTRHNVGFWALESLIPTISAGGWSRQGGCSVTKAKHSSADYFLIRPEQYMNLSGEAAVPVLRYFKVQVPNTVVIHDDLDLPVGAVRLKAGGGTGGHHGLDDLERHLGSRDFIRVRIGIGHPRDINRGEGAPKGGANDVTGWVLGAPKGDELKRLELAAEQAAKSVISIFEEGFTATQQRFHSLNS